MNGENQVNQRDFREYTSNPEVLSETTQRKKVEVKIQREHQQLQKIAEYYRKLLCTTGPSAQLNEKVRLTDPPLQVGMTRKYIDLLQNILTLSETLHGIKERVRKSYFEQASEYPEYSSESGEWLKQYPKYAHDLIKKLRALQWDFSPHERWLSEYLIHDQIVESNHLYGIFCYAWYRRAFFHYSDEMKEYDRSAEDVCFMEEIQQHIRSLKESLSQQNQQRYDRPLRPEYFLRLLCDVVEEKGEAVMPKKLKTQYRWLLGEHHQPNIDESEIELMYHPSAEVKKRFRSLVEEYFAEFMKTLTVKNASSFSCEDWRHLLRQTLTHNYSSYNIEFNKRYGSPLVHVDTRTMIVPEVDLARPQSQKYWLYLLSEIIIPIYRQEKCQLLGIANTILRTLKAKVIFRMPGTQRFERALIKVVQMAFGESGSDNFRERSLAIGAAEYGTLGLQDLQHFLTNIEVPLDCKIQLDRGDGGSDRYVRDLALEVFTPTGDIPHQKCLSLEHDVSEIWRLIKRYLNRPKCLMAMLFEVTALSPLREDQSPLFQALLEQHLRKTH